MSNPFLSSPSPSNIAATLTFGAELIIRHVLDPVGALELLVRKHLYVPKLLHFHSRSFENEYDDREISVSFFPRSEMYGGGGSTVSSQDNLYRLFAPGMGQFPGISRGKRARSRYSGR